MENKTKDDLIKVDRKIIFHSIKDNDILAMPGDYIYTNKYGNIGVLKPYTIEGGIKMEIEEAINVFLNRGYVEAKGGKIYDGDAWRTSCVVISKMLEDHIDEIKTLLHTAQKGKWIEVETNMYTCSKCNHCFTIDPDDNHISEFKYCPNCRDPK